MAGLLAGAFRQVGAADALRKTQVVLNPRTGRGLPANCPPFENAGLQSFGRSVNGGAGSWGQPSFSVIWRTVGASIRVPSEKMQTGSRRSVLLSTPIRLACSSV